MPIPHFKRHTETPSGDYWRPFFVADTGGFEVLFEDWTVGGGSEQHYGDDSDAGSSTSWGLVAVCVGAALLTLTQRLLHNAARGASATASAGRPASCSCCGGLCCNYGAGVAAWYYGCKQAVLQALAFVLHLLVILTCVTFNIWIFLACCAGAFVGEVLGCCCQRWHRRAGFGPQYALVPLDAQGRALEEDADGASVPTDGAH
jgi:hypothetical protein|eukprot:SAG25_NODE_879_length_4972_cov_6.738559_6_plen_203_part_00